MSPAFWKKKVRKKNVGNTDDEFVLEQIYQDAPEDRALFYDYCFIPGENFQVYIHLDALNNAYDHSKRGLVKNKEIAGVLIGSVFIDRERNVEFIEIVNILEAQTDQSSSVDVNIPATEWSRMMDFVEQSPKYRGKWSIVGWYHSHPNMRAFMSITDESTQLRHFNHRGQVAIVLGIGNGYSEVKCFDHSSKEVNLYFHPQDNDTKLNIASLSLLKKGKSFSTEQNKINSGGIQNSIAFLDTIISRIFHDCNSEAENFNLQESVSLKGHIRGFDKWYPNIYIAISYYVSINDKNPVIMIASTDYYTSLVINIGKIEPKLDLSIVSQIKDVLEFHRQNNYFRSLDEVDAAIKQCDSLITSRIL